MNDVVKSILSVVLFFICLALLISFKGGIILKIIIFIV